jgi:hypothetical protein
MYVERKMIEYPVRCKMICVREVQGMIIHEGHYTWTSLSRSVYGDWMTGRRIRRKFMHVQILEHNL